MTLAVSQNKKKLLRLNTIESDRAIFSMLRDPLFYKTFDCRSIFQECKEIIFSKSDHLDSQPASQKSRKINNQPDIQLTGFPSIEMEVLEFIFQDYLFAQQETIIFLHKLHIPITRSDQSQQLAKILPSNCRT